MTLLRTVTIALLLISTNLHAQESKSIAVGKAVARATVGKQPNGAAFLQIENRGTADDSLLSASSPAASRVEIHTMHMEGDVMKMRALERLDIKAGQTVAMKPGSGVHLMLMGLKKPLVVGETVAVTLNFRNAGKVDVTAEVAAMGMPKPAGGAAGHGHHHHD
jgi:copper(I)-binding protein